MLSVADTVPGEKRRKVPASCAGGRLIFRTAPGGPFSAVYVAFDGDAWYNECVAYGVDRPLQGNLCSEENIMFSKIGRIRWIVFGVAVLAMGVGFLIHGLSVVRGLKSAVDVKDTGISSYEEGMWIKGTTDYVWEYYCSESENDDNSKTERYRWYLVWIDAPVSSESDTMKDCYLGVKVPSSEYENYEKLKSEDLQYELTFQGKLVACSGDVLKYKNEFIAEADRYSMEKSGVKISQIYILPDYYIELTTTKTGNRFIAIGAACIVIVLVIGVFFIRSIRNNSKYSSYDATAGAASNNMAYGYGTERPASYASSAQGAFARGGADSGGSSLPNSSVGASTGFYRQDDQDELSRMLAEEDQKVANYNFKTGLTGSNRVEDDK